jgi:hypothetical protein
MLVTIVGMSPRDAELVTLGEINDLLTDDETTIIRSAENKEFMQWVRMQK